MRTSWHVKAFPCLLMDSSDARIVRKLKNKMVTGKIGTFTSLVNDRHRLLNILPVMSPFRSFRPSPLRWLEVAGFYILYYLLTA